MSDPFSDIDNEVYLDKIKSFFNKFKFRIIGITSFLLIVAIGFSLYSNSKNNKKAKLSEYYVEILSIIEYTYILLTFLFLREHPAGNSNSERSQPSNGNPNISKCFNIKDINTLTVYMA